MVNTALSPTTTFPVQPVTVVLNLDIAAKQTRKIRTVHTPSASKSVRRDAGALFVVIGQRLAKDKVYSSSHCH